MARGRRVVARISSWIRLSTSWVARFSAIRNRIHDADGTSVLDLIRRLKSQTAIPLMLVSNFETAQREAVVAGALPGFGKSALGQPSLADCLRLLLQDETR